MLKALEIVGFKSFADKTRFEFPAGITVIVGPNGSGKSNVVDAIKWVLGEQSVKSLRGKEMADVIFKGSPTGGRKPMNFAEATIVFENGDGRLPIEASEVRVTRRVYRSGEGEYLINGQACRLKDIRDMFRGTGVGTDSYSLIEQGKVDRMLQASPKERRAMFEEAAGISRFKAKKLETERRLERVSQNLLRLADIVEEVESRLRTVRSQATKARRYREHQQRLHELRTQVGLSDWHRLQMERESSAAAAEEVRGKLAAVAQECEELEQTRQIAEARLGELQRRIEEGEHRAAAARETLAVCKSRQQHLKTQHGDLAHQQTQLRRRLVLLRDRAGDVDERLESILSEIATEEAKVVSSRQLVAALTSAWHRSRAAAQHCSEELERWRALAAADRQVVTTWEQHATRCVEDWRSARQELETTRESLDALAAEASSLSAQRTAVTASVTTLQTEAQHIAERLDALRLDQNEEERLLARRQEELMALQSRLTGLKERSELLAELERKREGVGAGPREVLRRFAESAGPPYEDVVGLLGDCLDVPLEYAPLVDNVLGALTTSVVLRPGASIQQWLAIRKTLPGRVHLIPLDEFTERVGEAESATLDELAGGDAVRLSDLVAVSAELEPLRDGLLGKTYLVDDIEIARRLHARDRTLKFVTPSGEQLLSDGSLVLGPGSTSANLVSRRSELRVLNRGVQTVENQIAMAQDELERLRRRVTARTEEIRQRETELSRLKERLADHRVSLLTVEDQLQRLERSRVGELHRLEFLRKRLHRASARRWAAKRLANNAARQVSWIEDRLADALASKTASERAAAAASEELRQAEIALARLEEWVASLNQQRARIESDREERVSAVQETSQQLDQIAVRLQQVEREWLAANAREAGTCWQLQQLLEAAKRLEQDRAQALSEQAAAARELESRRRASRRLEQELQQHELESQQSCRQIEELARRYRDDYQIDLAQLAEEGASQGDGERAEIEEEIAKLRQVIAEMGAVNMEALEELDSLEERYASLSGQYQDMVQAKAALERIIQKINADSRRLFVETLETIRKNFQQLYRKSFGGGHADLVVEEGVDILEAGIDIVATPPGKPSFNNSLLSGGERALTAVSLLLAIFEYRPSPFCVLDEVDAPFDEANIGRFVEVLKDFLGWTRFVIVTHSKKTMTAADTLYGVTMQESGVSKQVSVRFEDVSDNGEIRPGAGTADEEAA